MALADAGHLSVGDARLEYRWLRASTHGHRAITPAIVMLHEGLGSVATWRDFPSALCTATDCDVLVYSRAGYGGSSPCTLPRPLHYMHDEALEVLPRVLAHLGRRPVVLLGHSDGASIATIHAGSRHDADVAALVLIAPHFFTEDCGIASISKAAEAFRDGDLRARLARYHGDNVDLAFLGWSGAWLDPRFRAWDIREHLPGIHVPVLVVQGEADEYGTIAQVQAVRDAAAGPVEVAMLAGCRHSPHRDQPERTVALVARFLRRALLGSTSETWSPRAD